jgi:organic hydroperoxide reductase OsmC/OhrA
MYKYNIEVEWLEDRRTRANIGGTQLEIDSPPEFNGSAEKLTPEELLPATLASCLLTTFFRI